MMRQNIGAAGDGASDKPLERLGRNKTRRLFLYGYYGQKNVGDDAMLYAFLVECSPKPFDFLITCGEARPALPVNVARRTTLIRTSPFDVVTSLIRASAFVIVGGTHLSDYGRRAKPLVMQGRILALVTLAKLLRKKIHFLAVGLGPFERRPTALLAKSSCFLADDISVRDLESLAVARKFGLDGGVTLSFDLSALLKPDKEVDKLKSKTDRKVLGMSITPITGDNSDERMNARFLQGLAESLSLWLRKNPEWTVRLFVFHGESENSNHDVAVTRELKKRVDSDRITVFDYDPDPRAMMNGVAQCAVFVGMKFHSCLFAYLTCTPLLVIPYHAKCAALAREIGLPPAAIVYPRDVAQRGLDDSLDHLSDSPEDFTASLPRDTAVERAKSAFSKLYRTIGD